MKRLQKITITQYEAGGWEWSLNCNFNPTKISGWEREFSAACRSAKALLDTQTRIDRERAEAEKAKP